VRKFWRPTIWANDVATMTYGMHFFIAAAYTKHIRTDFLSQRWSLKTQVRLDIAVPTCSFFLPGMAMFFWLSWNGRGLEAGDAAPGGGRRTEPQCRSRDSPGS
jgi:TRAP-type mannitol/chloroaromatic compound transport system permease small subunit